MKKTEFEYQYIKKCSECKTSFGSQSIHLIERLNGVSEIYVECKKCKSSSLIYVVKNDGSFVTKIDMPTDMKKRDITRLHKSKSITEDEVLEVHNFFSFS